jgi:hypothetical protein
MSAMSISDPLDFKWQVLQRLIAKGILSAEALTIVQRVTLQRNGMDDATVDLMIEHYADAIVRLKRHATDAKLSEPMFLSMADSIATTINRT